MLSTTYHLDNIIRSIQNTHTLKTHTTNKTSTPDPSRPNHQTLIPSPIRALTPPVTHSHPQPQPPPHQTPPTPPTQPSPSISKSSSHPSTRIHSENLEKTVGPPPLFPSTDSGILASCGGGERGTNQRQGWVSPPLRMSWWVGGDYTRQVYSWTVQSHVSLPRCRDSTSVRQRVSFVCVAFSSSPAFPSRDFLPHFNSGYEGRGGGWEVGGGDCTCRRRLIFPLNHHSTHMTRRITAQRDTSLTSSQAHHN